MLTERQESLRKYSLVTYNLSLEICIFCIYNLRYSVKNVQNVILVVVYSLKTIEM